MARTVRRNSRSKQQRRQSQRRQSQRRSQVQRRQSQRRQSQRQSRKQQRRQSQRRSQVQRQSRKQQRRQSQRRSQAQRSQRKRRTQKKLRGGSTGPAPNITEAQRRMAAFGYGGVKSESNKDSMKRERQKFLNERKAEAVAREAEAAAREAAAREAAADPLEGEEGYGGIPIGDKELTADRKEAEVAEAKRLEQEAAAMAEKAEAAAEQETAAAAAAAAAAAEAREQEEQKAAARAEFKGMNAKQLIVDNNGYHTSMTADDAEKIVEYLNKKQIFKCDKSSMIGPVESAPGDSVIFKVVKGVIKYTVGGRDEGCTHINFKKNLEVEKIQEILNPQ
jgi:hypothetical protein